MLEKKIAAMSFSQNNTKSKKKKRQSKPRNNQAQQSPSPFPGIPSVGPTSAQTVVAHRDPLVHNVVAQLNPFRVPRGIASGLIEAKPSQKFTARGVMSVTIPASSGSTVIQGVLLVSPCVASDANAISARLLQGTGTAFAGQVLTAATLFTGVTETVMTTNTPYDALTLTGKDFTWRLVSAGLRIRNITAAVNRQGVMLGLLDHDQTLLQYSSTSNTLTAVVNALNSNHRTVRINMASKPDMEFPISNAAVIKPIQWREQQDAATPSVNSFSFYDPANIVLTLNGNYGGLGGGYYVFPSVASAQSYEVELIEHWEVSGSKIETLHTPSATNSLVAEAVSNIIKQSHHQHALTPEVALHDVARGVAYGEHHKSTLQQCASVAAALALL